MTYEKDSLTGEKLRLEWLRELRRLREWRPGPKEFFTIQTISDHIRNKYEGTIDKELTEIALNSLLQENLAQAVINDNTIGIQITQKGLEYLNHLEEVPQKQNIVIGTISGSIVNIDAQLNNVTQNIGTANNIDKAVREQLTELVDQLKSELQKATPAREEEAEAVATSAQAFVEAGTKAQPNKATVHITAEGLKKAAENIADVMPTVLIIVSRIVKIIFPLIGIPPP